MYQHRIDRRQFGATVTAGAAGSVLSFPSVWAASLAQPSLRVIGETVIDAQGLNFVQGRWGTCINGQTFQEKAVATHQGYQYAAYFHNSGRLAFDHHVNPLNYRVSKRGVAMQPARFDWEASLFGPTTDTLDGQRRIKRVTYPMFAPAPQGGLLLYFRTGGSGSGDWYWTKYDAANSRWAPPLLFLAKEGSFQDSSSRCAYPNGLQYDARGRLHVTWCWRETPDLRSNHDLMYAYSDDRGQTWRNNAGQPIGVSGKKPIRVDSPGVVVVPIAYGWGMMNQLTQDVDGQGRVHVILWHNPPDAPGPNPDLNAWRYHHYWRDESGQWHRQKLPFFGRKPRLVVDQSGDALMVFIKGSDLRYHGRDPGGQLHVAAATARQQWTDWHVVHTSTGNYVGEPRVDTQRWLAEHVLSVYAQQQPDQPGEPSPLCLLDFER